MTFVKEIDFGEDTELGQIELDHGSEGGDSGAEELAGVAREVCCVNEKHTGHTVVVILRWKVEGSN